MQNLALPAWPHTSVGHSRRDQQVCKTNMWKINQHCQPLLAQMTLHCKWSGFWGLSSPPSSLLLLQVMDIANSITPNGGLFIQNSSSVLTADHTFHVFTLARLGMANPGPAHQQGWGFIFLLNFQTEISPVLLSTEIMNIITSPYQVPEMTS